MSFTLTIELALTTGTRRGEVCGLRWSDIGEQTVTVGRVVILDAGTPYVKEPKTQASCRTIPLTKRLYAVLRAIEKDRRYVAGELGVPFGDLFSPLVSPEPVPDTLGIGPIPQKHADGHPPGGRGGGHDGGLDYERLSGGLPQRGQRRDELVELALAARPVEVLDGEPHGLHGV